MKEQKGPTDAFTSREPVRGHHLQIPQLPLSSTESESKGRTETLCSTTKATFLWERGRIMTEKIPYHEEW